MTTTLADDKGDDKSVNTYQFMDALSDHLTATDTLVTGNGTDVVSYYHSYPRQTRAGTINTGWGSKGWDLPNALGACVGNGKQRTILVTGDGRSAAEHPGTSHRAPVPSAGKDFHLQQSGLHLHP